MWQEKFDCTACTVWKEAKANSEGFRASGGVWASIAPAEDAHKGLAGMENYDKDTWSWSPTEG